VSPVRSQLQPPSFFLKGLIALVVLLLVTFVIPPRPELNALRAFIAVAMVIAGGKMILRYYNVDWPSKRRGRS
jgi:hypothetical protein